MFVDGWHRGEDFASKIAQFESLSASALPFHWKVGVNVAAHSKFNGCVPRCKQGR